MTQYAYNSSIHNTIDVLQARKNGPERGFLCKIAETRGASRLR